METSTLIALGALLVSVLTYFGMDRRIKRLELAKLEEEAALDARSELHVWVERYEPGRGSLFIENIGGRDALNIELPTCRFARPRGGHRALTSRQWERFPVKVLHARDRTGIPLMILEQTQPPLKVELRWTEPDGRPRELHRDVQF